MSEWIAAAPLLCVVLGGLAMMLVDAFVEEKSELATTTAVTRLMMDRHWATDVAVGAGIGLLSGFGVAYGLHYGSWTWKTKEVRAAMVPATFGTGLGAQVLGAF